MLLNTRSSLVNEMIADFELERQEKLALLNHFPAGSAERLSCVNRLAVIDQSVAELRLQIQDPTRLSRQQQGGYSAEELQRFYDSKQ